MYILNTIIVSLFPFIILNNERRKNLISFSVVMPHLFFFLFYYNNFSLSKYKFVEIFSVLKDILFQPILMELIFLGICNKTKTEHSNIATTSFSLFFLFLCFSFISLSFRFFEFFFKRTNKLTFSSVKYFFVFLNPFTPIFQIPADPSSEKENATLKPLNHYKAI